MPPGFLTVAETAARLGVTSRRVLRRIEKGDLPGTVKFGRDWAVPVKALEKLVRTLAEEQDKTPGPVPNVLAALPHRAPGGQNSTTDSEEVP